MARDIYKISQGLASIAARDREAHAIAEREGISFSEAWQRLLDEEERAKESVPIRGDYRT